MTEAERRCDRQRETAERAERKKSAARKAHASRLQHSGHADHGPGYEQRETGRERRSEERSHFAGYCRSAGVKCEGQRALIS